MVVTSQLIMPYRPKKYVAKIRKEYELDIVQSMMAQDTFIISFQSNKLLTVVHILKLLPSNSVNITLKKLGPKLHEIFSTCSYEILQHTYQHFSHSWKLRLEPRNLYFCAIRKRLIYTLWQEWIWINELVRVKGCQLPWRRIHTHRQNRAMHEFFELLDNTSTNIGVKLVNSKGGGYSDSILLLMHGS